MKSLVDTMPEATHLFMYRNVIDWLASCHRLRVNRGDTPTRYSLPADHRAAGGVLPVRCRRIRQHGAGRHHKLLQSGGTGAGLACICWSAISSCGKPAEPIKASRYEDLQANHDAVLRQVLQMMGLPESALSGAKRAFETDAQAGTEFARDEGRGITVRLPADMRATVRRILSTQQEL